MVQDFCGFGISYALLYAFHWLWNFFDCIWVASLYDGWFLLLSSEDVNLLEVLEGVFVAVLVEFAIGEDECEIVEEILHYQ